MLDCCVQDALGEVLFTIISTIPSLTLQDGAFASRVMIKHSTISTTGDTACNEGFQISTWHESQLSQGASCLCPSGRVCFATTKTGDRKKLAVELTGHSALLFTFRLSVGRKHEQPSWESTNFDPTNVSEGAGCNEKFIFPIAMQPVYLGFTAVGALAWWMLPVACSCEGWRWLLVLAFKCEIPCGRNGCSRFPHEEKYASKID